MNRKAIQEPVRGGGECLTRIVFDIMEPLLGRSGLGIIPYVVTIGGWRSSANGDLPCVD